MTLILKEEQKYGLGSKFIKITAGMLVSLVISCVILSRLLMQWKIDVINADHVVASSQIGGEEAEVRYKAIVDIEKTLGTFVSSHGIKDTATFIFTIDEKATKKVSEFIPSILEPLMRRYKIEPGFQLQPKHLPTVYVETHMLQAFSRFCDQIPFPYVLLSGDDDVTMPQGVGLLFTDHILKTPQLIRWYAQNLGIVDNIKKAKYQKYLSKVSHMPIGMDYHTLEENPEKVPHWGTKASRLEQEEELLNIIRNSKPLKNRQIRMYSTFHGNVPDAWHASDREEAFKYVPTDLIDHEENKITRSKTWQKQTEYAFVASPHGRGLDCHRTWEALLLGCIVIVKTSALDAMYAGLPVVIVERWSDVTEGLLQRSHAKFSAIQEKRHKNNVEEYIRAIPRLQLAHWVKLMGSTESEHENVEQLMD